MVPKFEQIVGHKRIKEHLENAMKLDKISHAYIFNGEKGSGKKLLAAAFAQSLQCEGEGILGCGECKSCKQAENKNNPDIIRIIHEKPNIIGADEVKEQLVNDIQIKPYRCKYKIYIINDAEKMTPQAQNAILKTIEEPPEYVIVLLLTSNAQALLSTIMSRCVMLSTKPVSDEQVKDYLMKNVRVPDYQADISVAFAQGNIGKAVELASSDSFGEIKASAIHLLKNIPMMNLQEMIGLIKAVSEFKVEIDDYLNLMAVWYRDVLYFKATKDVNGLTFKEEINEISKQTKKGPYEGVENILKALQTAKERLKANVNFDLTMELLFLAIKENLGE